MTKINLFSLTKFSFSRRKKHCNIGGVVQKSKPLQFCYKILIACRKSLTGILNNKFATKLSLKTLNPLQHITVLPCEIFYRITKLQSWWLTFAHPLPKCCL